MLKHNTSVAPGIEAVTGLKVVTLAQHNAELGQVVAKTAEVAAARHKREDAIAAARNDPQGRRQVKLTAPGPTDLHWMLVLLTGDGIDHYDFFEDQASAERAAGTILADNPGSSVYVSRIYQQGEHVRPKRNLRRVKR